MREYLLDRIRLVRELMTGGPRVEYGDLVLILTAVLSACAAQRWPGTGFDRKRFVELLIAHSPPVMHCDYVCVVSLLNAGLISERQTPWGADPMRIYRDIDIDMPHATACVTFAHLSPVDLKKHSYAALIYSWLRCPYAHEYTGGKNTTQVPPSYQEARMSYMGRMLPGNTMMRIASFHLEYLIALAEHHADTVPNTPQANPQNWWVTVP